MRLHAEFQTFKGFFLGSPRYVSTVGHRGKGQTDERKLEVLYGNTQDLSSLPVESTQASVHLAFKKGADAVELDAVMSEDEIVFVLHSVRPTDHFFGPDAPEENLNKLPWEKFKNAQIGRVTKGNLSSLEDMLNLIADLDPGTRPYAVNIELKGVQWTDQPWDTICFIQAVARAVRNSRLPPARILFSSFALQNIIEMANRMPEAQYGMLFDAHRSDNTQTAPIYSDRTDDFAFRYLRFTKEHVEKVACLFKRGVTSGAKLTYLHPETGSLDEDTFKELGAQGWRFNPWGYLETLDDKRLSFYKRLAVVAQENKIYCGFITDYLDQMIANVVKPYYPSWPRRTMQALWHRLKRQPAIQNG